MKEHVRQRCKNSKVILQWWKCKKPQLKQKLKTKLAIKIAKYIWRGF